MIRAGWCCITDTQSPQHGSAPRAAKRTLCAARATLSPKADLYDKQETRMCQIRVV
ncbi:hypothetical protein DPMN_164053 [Dreissena polymorpha]|uniref:Uncharacterized protein n=1 Tax=Dreissena polymorpha TaxID=45954 RepID=A0A9D4EXX9_DREPO|nr:hypothetical protein DPMN_164053 [Dreissena polymorpha]